MLGTVAWQAKAKSALVQERQWRQTSQWKAVCERLENPDASHLSFQSIYKAPLLKNAPLKGMMQHTLIKLLV